MMNNKTRIKKISFAIFVLIILICTLFIYFFNINSQQKVIEDKKNVLYKLENKLNKITEELNENQTILNNWQEGDNYNLHDPFFDEVLSFIESDNSTYLNIAINNAKNMSIRCALAQIIISEDLYMIELIAFETIDEGMVYFEIWSDLQVEPAIGINYSDCVLGEPERFARYNDPIVDILLIW